MRPKIPFLLAPLSSLPFLFSIASDTASGHWKKEKRKKEEERKEEFLPQTRTLARRVSQLLLLLSAEHGESEGLLKINLSGIESVQRLYLDSVERAELHLRFNRAWKWRFLISRNFLRMILSFFYYYYYYFLKINPSFYNWLSNYNLFEYPSFFRG